MTLRTGNKSLAQGSRLKAQGHRFQTKFFPSAFSLEPRATRAFTLVEMLIVLAIIVMIMAISVPFTSGFGKGLRIKTATRAIVGVMRVAKSNAITFREKYSVVFDVRKSQYWIEDETGRIYEKKYLLPSSIKFEVKDDEESDPVTFENDKITFNSSGSIEGNSGSVTFTDKQGGSRTISVTGATGRITIN